MEGKGASCGRLVALRDVVLLITEDPLGREWLPTPVFLPGESLGQRSLADYSPWGQKESDMT